MGAELTGVSKAAALHGVAINSVYPQADRLRAAIQALDIYEQEYDALTVERDRLRDNGINKKPRPQLYGPVPPVELTDEQAESLFPIGAWKNIFSMVPRYPTDLPDDVVRYIADLAIRVRELAENLGPALKSQDRLAILMDPSLISGSLRRINEFISAECERGGF
jgi:hypothetical protein